MARKIVWSLAAANDVESIEEYLRQSSPLYANRFIVKVRDSTKNLKQMPERGRHVPEYPESGLREIFVDSFRVFYRVSADQVEIAGVFHMARDIRQLGIFE